MSNMETFTDELRKAGILKDCDGLRPTREARHVRFDGTTRTVVDGSFKGDLIGGYWIWQLPSWSARLCLCSASDRIVS